MRQKRAYRWLLFLVAVFCFFRFVFFGRGAWSLLLFTSAGGLWYWLEFRKMRELDAPRPK